MLFGAFIVLPVALLWIVLYTSWGAQWAWRIAQQQVAAAGMELQGQLQGSLAGPIELVDVHFTTEGLDIELGRAAIEWQWYELLDSKVTINRIELDELAIVLLETDAQAQQDAAAEPFKPAYPELPVSISLAELLLTDATLRTSAEAEPLTLDRLELSAALTDTELQVSRLLVSGQGLEADLTAASQNRKGLPLTLAGQFSYASADLPVAEGTLEVGGTLDGLSLQGQLNAPYNLVVHAEVTDILADLAAAFELTFNETQLGWLHAELIDRTLNGTVAAAYAHPEISILKADLNSAASALSASGSYNLTTQLVDLQGHWQALRWPVAVSEPAVVESDSGEFRVSGELKDYQAELNGSVVLPEASGVLQLSASGSDQHLTVQEFVFDVFEGRLAGSGEVSWAPDLKLALTATGTGINPGMLVDGYPGKLDLQLNTRVQQVADRWQGVVTELEVSGQLREQALEAALAGDFRASSMADLDLNLGALTVDWGGVSVSGSGGLSQASDFAWQVEIARLNQLAQDFAGAVTGSGTLRGKVQDPELTATLSIAEFTHPSMTPHEVQLSLDVKGKLSDHQLALNGSSEWGSLQLALSAGLREDSYQFVVQDLQVPMPIEGVLRLESPTEGQLGQVAQVLAPLCLASSEIHICVDFEQTASVQQAGFKLSQFPLKILAPWLPPRLQLVGSVAGEGRFSDWQVADRQLKGIVDLSVQGVSVAARRRNGIQPLLDFDPGHITLTTDAEQMQLVAHLPLTGANNGKQVNADKKATELPPAGGLRLEGTLLHDEPTFADRSISGRAEFDLHSIELLELFSDQVEQLDGTLKSQLTLGGRLSAPELAGEARVAQLQASIPELGIMLRESHVTLNLPTPDTLSIDAQLKSGAGAIQVSGSINDLMNDYQGELKVRGSDFLALNNSLAEVIVSPTVDAEFKNQALHLSGKVLLPKAVVELEEVPQAAVQPSDDQIMVDEEPEEESPIAVFADLDLELGDEVSFTGLGLTAEFAGTLAVTERPDEVTTAKGEITITEGSYQAYGQDLAVRDGKLIWVDSPLANPGLDIYAMRQPKPDIEVGVRARGTLASPRLSLTSDPNMSESDRLSYLVLGRPLEGSTPAEGSYLNKAALALGIKGGNYLTERYGEKLGVDEIGIETAPGEDAEQAALVVGKYLSPRLYVSYGLGLLDSISTLRLEYTLTRDWSIKTESSAEQSGGDLHYSIELP